MMTYMHSRVPVQLLDRLLRGWRIVLVPLTVPLNAYRANGNIGVVQTI